MGVELRLLIDESDESAVMTTILGMPLSNESSVYDISTSTVLLEIIQISKNIQSNVTDVFKFIQLTQIHITGTTGSDIIYKWRFPIS
ncbi:hypothetical protein TcWFU_000155 [Taenia crassiceps]|uniref:Uncharacterized protein n=1 Tax=Taenia crassiceps TaxID=6207 RepID=A0ABR4QCK2_9CEST